MKIIDIDLRENGKKYFCKQVNEVFEVEEGNLIAATRSFSMAELLKMDFEEIKTPKNPYTRVDNGKGYNYFISSSGTITTFTDRNNGYADLLFNSANYFNNKNYAEYIAFKESLMKKLDRFAWEHNAKAVKWDRNVAKYYIIFNYYGNKKLEVCGCFSMQSNDIYFTSKEIAKMALEKFKEDLIKLYTWEFDF